MESESATLTCSLSQILEDATITWYNGVTTVIDDTTNYVITTLAYDEDRKSKSSELEIKAVKLGALSDYLSFTCSATIGQETIEAEKTLQVFSES